jgi:alpha-galactosidase
MRTKITSMPKIVCLGAGSAVFGLSNLATIVRSERLRGSEIVLVDIDAAGLEIMTRLAHLMNESWDAQIKIWSTTEREEALPGADFVVVSVQVGPREDVWELDWQIPLRHGVRQPYAENSGPGGFAHTARNAPLILAIARDMERLCPDAWFLNFTNPMIRLTWVVERYTDVKVVGLCHQLYWAYGMAGAVLADRWGLVYPDDFHVHTDYDNADSLFVGIAQAVPRMDIKAAGLNHFSWVYDIRDKETGEDLYPLLRERWLKHFRRSFEPLSREMFEIFGLMPTAGDAHLCEYLPWTHDPVKKPWVKYHLTPQNWDGNRQRRADRWAQALAIVNGECPVDELRFAISEGVPEIVEAITFNDNYYHHQLNLPNHGLIPNLPEDAIVEVPGMISRMGIRGLNMPPLPEGIAELCRRELALSSITIDACIHGDRQLALQALLLDPMINDIDTARAILDDFLTTFAEYLPQFA